MSRRTLFLTIVSLLAFTRLCHLRILWVEEAYPLAAAAQMLRGRALYREIWFDKPPAFPALYLLWGAQDGWPLRIAGIVLAALFCFVAYWSVRRVWSEREGLWAAALAAFFLSFDTPSAVMALTPDLLTVPFHFAAIAFAMTGQPFCAGLAAGGALLFNSKAVLLLIACLLWQWRHLPKLAAGFAVPIALAAAVLASQGALSHHWIQVWWWGSHYSRDTPLPQPWLEGLKRTLNWAGFHLALLSAAAFTLHRERESRVRFALWAVLSLGAVWLGLRFFPRYYFHLLVPAVFLAARGLALLPKRHAAMLCLLLLVPLARFGGRYVTLASDLVQSRPHEWRDLALEQDSRRAAVILRANARRDDALLVWGYRPELFLFSGLLPASRYLDSQPLSGVIADRHLTSATPTFPELARANRQALTPPDWVADGLGPINPPLSFFSSPEFAAWRTRYSVVASTSTYVLYRKRPRE
jgi:hypothetical protein